MTIAQINQGKNEFEWCILLQVHFDGNVFTTTAVQSVVEPCNIAVYLHSKSYIFT